MSESYTHLLISTSKTHRPTAQAVCQFLEQLIQTGLVGQDHAISFSKVVKAEQRYWEATNPFTGKFERHRMPARRMQHAKPVPAASQILALAEQEREYDVSVVSTVPPTNPPLEIGSVGEKGTWQSWTGPYHLKIGCRVRASLVCLCVLTDPCLPPDIEAPTFDEDCADDWTDGFFEHPLLPSPKRIRNAGRGRFWIEFEYGKWLCPRLKNDGVALLAPGVTRLAEETFSTGFVEACLWG